MAGASEHTCCNSLTPRRGLATTGESPLVLALSTGTDSSYVALLLRMQEHAISFICYAPPGFAQTQQTMRQSRASIYCTGQAQLLHTSIYTHHIVTNNSVRHSMPLYDTRAGYAHEHATKLTLTFSTATRAADRAHAQQIARGMAGTAGQA